MDSENKLQWYVIRTKSRQEKKVAQLLSDIGFTIYIPLQTTIRQWSDRKKKVQTPYIPGYLFVQTQKSTLQAIYNIPLKISLLSEFGKNVVIRDQDIEQLKRICNHENPPIINAFNLIDGIDGLASVIGLIAFASFGLLFYLVNQPFYLGLACSGFMMLLAFLRFNLTKDLKLKTFMGDTGSMIIGFIIAVFSLRILSLDSSELKALPLSSENIPILIIAILIVPLFDTSRVFTIRVMEGRKPFSADKSHIHHVLINKFKISHRKASFLIGLINILFAVLFFISAIKFNHLHLLFLLLFIIFLFVYFFYKINNALRK